MNPCAEVLGSLLGTAMEAARAAGKLVVAERQKALGTIDSKRDINDLVTAADKASEGLIVQRIREEHPDHGIIGEEGARTNPDAPYQWVIDPIDGTVNYIYGSGPYAISIGVELDGEPIVGVIHIPAMGEMFAAAVGCGAFLNDIRLQVSTPDSLTTSVIAFDGPTWKHAEQGSLLTAMGSNVRAARRIGSAASALAYVAAGRFDGFVVHDVGHWDVSAGTIIVREAGGWVGNSQDGKPTPIETIACSPAIAAEMRALLS